MERDHSVKNLKLQLLELEMITLESELGSSY